MLDEFWITDGQGFAYLTNVWDGLAPQRATRTLSTTASSRRLTKATSVAMRLSSGMRAIA